MTAKPGDRVRVSTDDNQQFEGILMPRHGFSGEDIWTIKLSNGYNIGLKGKIEQLEAGKKISVKLPTPSENPDLPTIALLGTGGTIASFVDYRTGGVHPATKPEELAAAAPDLFDVCNVRAEVVFQMFSEDMQPEHWTQIAERAAWHLNNGCRGVVIGHGTDTMSHTAAALAFSMKDLTGPVVLTGSQRSSDRPSSDASSNLLAAARLAATSDIGEVVVVMHETSDDTRHAIHRATRVRKMHTSRRDAFQSINAMPVGYVEGSTITWDKEYDHVVAGPTHVDGKWDENVSIIHAYPGLWPEHIEAVVRKGTVIVGTGLGHVAQRCLPGVKAVLDRGAHVVMASQCVNGRVNMNVYSTGRDLLKMGVMPAHDMLPEVAYIKLMWILGQTDDPAEVRRLFNTSIAHELAGNSPVLAFGHNQEA